MNSKLAYDIGWRLGLMKGADMGCAAKPVGKEQAPLIPRRYGMHGSTRRKNFERMDRISRPAMKS